MKKFLLLLILFPALLQAQPFLDLASVYFQYSAADRPKDNSTLYTELASVSLTLPLKIDSDYFVINPVYENFKITFPANYKDHTFQVAYLPLTWLHQWNAKWKTAFVFIPRMSSELKGNFTSNDMQYGGAVLTSFQKKETLKYKFGLYYNSEFFGPFFMPLLGIDWNVNSKLNIFGVLPGSMNIEYKFVRSVHAGILFRSITNSYRTYMHSFIRVNDAHLKFFLDFYPAKNHVISVEAGHTLFRKYKSGYRESGKADYHDLNVTDGLLFKIGYAFRLRTDEASSQ